MSEPLKLTGDCSPAERILRSQYAAQGCSHTVVVGEPCCGACKRRAHVALAAKVDAQAEEIAKRDRQIDALQREARDSNEYAQQQHDKAGALMIEIAALKAEVTKLHDLLADAIKQRDTSNAILDEQTTKIVTLKTENAALQGKLTAEEEVSEKLSKALGKKIDECADLCTQLNEARAKLTGADGALEGVGRYLQQIDAALGNTQPNVSVVDAAQAVAARADDLQKRLTEAEAAAEFNANEANQQRARADDLQKRLTEAEAEIDRVMGERDEWHKLYVDRSTQLTTERDALKAALKSYGNHLSLGCTVNGKCVCGYEAAVQGGKP